jgi:hypothetical protein
VFDYIPFPHFTHTTGMTHFLEIGINSCLEISMQDKITK